MVLPKFDRQRWIDEVTHDLKVYFGIPWVKPRFKGGFRRANGKQCSLTSQQARVRKWMEFYADKLSDKSTKGSGEWKYADRDVCAYILMQIAKTDTLKGQEVKVFLQRNYSENY